MKALKYVCVPWVGVFVYVLLAMYAGPMGIASYRSLAGEKEKEEANLAKLKVINRELEDRKNALLYDRDTLSVYARDLGFAAQGKKFLRIVGLEYSSRRNIFPGEVLTSPAPDFIDDSIIRIIALCAAAFVLAAFLVFDTLNLIRGKLYEPWG
ncbi:MAG: septum formation initiator family protein [Treponema sp.]|nr:septum formation initiator family protein [Treponema sp.]